MQNVRDNLSPLERQALKYLQRRRDIVIKPADKGSAVVVLRKEDYINEADRQLRNEDHYRKLENNPTALYTTEIKSVVTKKHINAAID